MYFLILLMWTVIEGDGVVNEQLTFLKTSFFSSDFFLVTLDSGSEMYSG